MKKYILFLLPVLLGCQSENTKSNQDETVTPFFFEVTAAFQTEAVSADPEADAADDPAIWYNEEDPSKSLILGSDKTNGVDVFDMAGKRLHTYLVGRINNIDVRNDAFPGRDVVGGSNRDSVGMDFWTVDAEARALEYIGHIPSDLPDVYGFCMYKQPNGGNVFAFVNSKTGKVEQWQLRIEEGKIAGELVRTLQLPSQVEGMVADDPLELLYVGVEEGGIYRFGANANDPAEGERLEQSGEENEAIRYDVEGLTIYPMEGNNGYLIASSQGNNTFAIFDRSGENAYLGSFEIVDGNVDGAQETDGIDVIHHSMGPEFPGGIFVVQDGFNYEGDTKVAQNFKVVSWEDIMKSMD
jgi:3-phytase